MRFFNQLENELLSHKHEEQWLREKGRQLAQRDSELAVETQKDIGLLGATWEATQRLIADG